MVKLNKETLLKLSILYMVIAIIILIVMLIVVIGTKNFKIGIDLFTAGVVSFGIGASLRKIYYMINKKK